MNSCSLQIDPELIEEMIENDFIQMDQYIFKIQW